MDEKKNIEEPLTSDSENGKLIIKVLSGLVLVLFLVLAILFLNSRGYLDFGKDDRLMIDAETRKLDSIITVIDRDINYQNFEMALLKAKDVHWNFEPESNKELAEKYKKVKENLRAKILDRIQQRELISNMPISPDSTGIYRVFGTSSPYKKSSLNLRSTLDSSFLLLDELDDGTRVRVIETGLGKNGNWYKVQTLNTKKIGYAFSKYLKQVDPNESCLVNHRWYINRNNKNEAYWVFDDYGKFTFVSNRDGMQKWTGRWTMDRGGYINLEVTTYNGEKMSQSLTAQLEGCYLLRQGSETFTRD